MQVSFGITLCDQPTFAPRLQNHSFFRLNQEQIFLARRREPSKYDWEARRARIGGSRLKGGEETDATGGGKCGRRVAIRKKNETPETEEFSGRETAPRDEKTRSCYKRSMMLHADNESARQLAT